MKPQYFPDFILFGAAKSGTTSLYHYLKKHPQIYMQDIKDAYYFALDENRKYPDFGFDTPAVITDFMERFATKTWEEYRSHFAGAASGQLLGEASPIYLVTERSPALIKAAIPDVRLVAVLRQPVAMAYSLFHMTHDMGQEPLAKFEDAVPLDGSPEYMGWRWKYYVEQAFHGRNLERFYKLFDREQIKIVLFDDLIADPGAVMRGIFEFIGVDSDINVDVDNHHFVSVKPRFTPAVKQILEAIVPQPVQAGLKDIFPNLTYKRVRLPAATRRKYLPLFREDIAKLEMLLDRDLSHWRI